MDTNKEPSPLGDASGSQSRWPHGRAFHILITGPLLLQSA